MHVVFRVDASVQIGMGHIMRCLTLANALRDKGVVVSFICRLQPGHLIETIERKNYSVFILETSFDGGELNSFQIEDAKACRPVVETIYPDWLIVDHYALDSQWHRKLKPVCKKLMVIDDLANRPLLCDVVLDQTYQRNKADYAAWVPASCKILTGSQYALLRPEFARLRNDIRQQRLSPALKKILISLGGTDPDNISGQVLYALRQCALPSSLKINVVLGPTAPHLQNVRQLAETMPYETRVYVNIENMAQLMADSDLAIGAAGTTTWERCCLGLPSLILVLADNQRQIAELLTKKQLVWGVQKETINQDLNKIFSSLTLETLAEKSAKTMQIVDGLGVERVMQFLL